MGSGDLGRRGGWEAARRRGVLEPLIRRNLMRFAGRFFFFKWVPFHLQVDALASSKNAKAKAGCSNSTTSLSLVPTVPAETLRDSRVWEACQEPPGVPGKEQRLELCFQRAVF